MPKEKPPQVTPKIGDAAVQAKTGKTWPEWFAVLDQAGADRMSHKEIVAYLAEHHAVGDWWQQSVTVAYEQARGLRARHEKPEGFQVSANRTIGVPAAKAYRAWNDRRLRARWLPDPDVAIRKATPDKSMRITWVDGQSRVDVEFYARGEAKCQVSVQHGKLPNARQASRMKAYWAKALDALRAVLEK